jgi:hypothetical protein
MRGVGRLRVDARRCAEEQCQETTEDGYDELASLFHRCAGAGRKAATCAVDVSDTRIWIGEHAGLRACVDGHGQSIPPTERDPLLCASSVVGPVKAFPHGFRGATVDSRALAQQVMDRRQSFLIRGAR